MTPSPQTNPFAQHYLEIKALDPAGSSQDPPPAVTNPGLVITLPLLIFFGVFIGVFTYIFFNRMQNLKTIFTIFVFALALGALPIGIQVLNYQTESSVKADPEIIPNNVIVTSVVPTGFAISWETSKLSSGAIKLSNTPSMASENQVYGDGNPKTYHRLVLLNLKPGTTYYLEILSDSQWFNHSGQPITITLPQSYSTSTTP
jgi:hypothetical protein